MKKRICLILAVLLTVTAALLVGCSAKKEFQCDLCGKVVNEKGHTVTILGEEQKICDACFEDLQAMRE